jgi:hypothetical protein
MRSPIPPIWGDSSEYVCFAADQSERQQSLSGWVMPLPNSEKPRTNRGTNPFTGEEMVVLDYSNPKARAAPVDSAYPKVDHLPRVGSVLLGRERLAQLINAIDGTSVQEVEGQIMGQMLLSSDDELGVVFRVPQRFVVALSKVKPADAATIAARWKPSLAAGPQYGDEASQPPIEKRTQALSAAIQLAALTLETNRDLFIWEHDF